MNVISNLSDEILKDSITQIFHPLVKETLKNVTSSVTFFFGLVEIYDLHQTLKTHKISTENKINFNTWKQFAVKIVWVCAKISLIISAGVSRPGVYIISSLIGCLNSNYFESVFGPNTLFVINPLHPRHMFSFVPLILTFPFIVHSLYQSLQKNKISQLSYQHPSIALNDHSYQRTELKLRLMVLFNTITCRPLLHLGNQFCHFLLKA